MKRGRPRKNKVEEGNTEKKPRRLKKVSDDEEEEQKEVVKKKGLKKLKRESEDKQANKDRKNEKKFEIPQLPIIEIYENIMRNLDKDIGLKGNIKVFYVKYKEIEQEITRRKNSLLRSNLQEKEYREEMTKLRADEKMKSSELFDQAIEKFTASQVPGFESLEELKKRFKQGQGKEKSTNVIAELLKTKLETQDEPEVDIDITPGIKDQFQRRRIEQQEVLLKIFRTKIDFGEEEPFKEQRQEKKYQIPSFKRAKSVQQEPVLPSMQRAASVPQPEPKVDPTRIEKVSLTESILKEDGIKGLINKKGSEIKKNLEYYYETCQKPKIPLGTAYEFNAEPSTIHPCLNEYEAKKMDRFAEISKGIKKIDDLTSDDLAFLIYVTEECTNKINQIRVTKIGDLKSLEISHTELRSFFDKMLNSS